MVVRKNAQLHEEAKKVVNAVSGNVSDWKRWSRTERPAVLGKLKKSPLEFLVKENDGAAALFFTDFLSYEEAKKGGQCVKRDAQ